MFLPDVMDPKQEMSQKFTIFMFACTVSQYLAGKWLCCMRRILFLFADKLDKNRQRHRC